MRLLVVSESGRLVGGHLLCVVVRNRARGRAARPLLRRVPREPWPLPLACASARGRRRPGERHDSARRACARPGISGVRLSDRRVVTSGHGVGRVRASDGDGAKPRRRHQRMRDRSSDAGQQPCDGRYEIRHDFPDPLDDCSSPASSRRPVQCRCLHRCISKQRANARSAAQTGAGRTAWGRRRRCACANVSVVQHAAARAGRRRARRAGDGGMTGAAHGARSRDSAGESHAPQADRFHSCNVRAAVSVRCRRHRASCVHIRLRGEPRTELRDERIVGRRARRDPPVAARRDARAGQRHHEAPAREFVVDQR